MMIQSSGKVVGRFALVAGALAGSVAVAPIGAQTVGTDAVGHTLGIDTTNFDRSVRPQDDFFRFVNGGWLTRTPIPNDASSWGAFNELREKSRTALHGILEDAASSNAAAGSDRRKAGDLYASFMDSARVESLGLTPLKGELSSIAALTTSKQLPATFAHFARLGVQSPIAVGVG
ncbi:MAG: M13 family peptidase, partial [Gemmatimonadaceae bacterium]